MTQNPFYEGSRPRHLDEIRIALDSNQASSILQIETGTADYEGGSLEPRFLRSRLAAARQTGPARFAAYAKLDADLMRVGAPIVPLVNAYRPELVSSRVRIDWSFYPPSLAGLDYTTTCLR